jgi:TonB family protein
MKKLFFTLLFIFSISSFSQESVDKIIYLDSLHKESTIDNYKTKRIIKDFNIDKSEYKVLEYDNLGNLQLEGNYSDKYSLKRTGEFTEYHKNGNKKSIKNYKDSKAFGTYYEWYENGAKKLEAQYTEKDLMTAENYKILQFWDKNNNHTVIDGNGFFSNNANENSIFEGNLKNGLKDGTWKGSYKDKYSFTEIYNQGKFVSGIRINSDNEKIEYSELESKPQPKKGIEKFYKYIGENFKYTDSSIKNKIQGKIIIQFIIDKTGKITEPKIIKGLGYGLDEEAIRVIMRYDDWIPGQQRGVNVRVQYMLPISLQLP